jgi:superfamily I DNA/RNA helicase
LHDKARAAQAEAASNGEIASLTRTHHGETRLPNAEKYDMGDGYRLVVQLVDAKQQMRAFLFAGKHDDADRWLDNHKDYVWIKRPTDGTLEFVQVTIREPSPRTPDLDLESPESLLELPLLRDLNEKEWNTLALQSPLLEYVKQVTPSRWETDAEGVYEHIEKLSPDKSGLLLDVLEHAHNREWSALHRRIEVVAGNAIPVEGKEAADAMLDPVNSEIFITWDDSKDLGEDKEWVDWMLFLHAEQKDLTKRDMSGPARLRGVSGSGKTCVMIHRARFLAKKYGQPTLVITLTASMRKLLDNLLGTLCGVERSLITTYTMTSLARDVVRELHPKSERWYTMARSERLRAILKEACRIVKGHSDFIKTPIRQLNDLGLELFLKEEIAYVRGRLRPSDYDKYPTKAFKRTGRSQALAEIGRRVCLEAINYWDQELRGSNTLDYEGIVQCALDLALNQDQEKQKFRWRSVLVDEVQDLSQLEVSLLANLMSPDGETMHAAQNGLFLVGDGAQSIYKKGFSLKSIGVNVSNRSYVFKKNYRNTLEILTAAYGLIRKYEFADIDEDNLQLPLEPDFATRRGEKPALVKCPSMAEEARFIRQSIQTLLAGKEASAAAQTCIIGANVAIRDFLANELTNHGILWAELREDAAVESERIKISTIESAKGHEFVTVFIAGLVEGVLPQRNIAVEDFSREAARLYVAMTRARDSLYLSYSSNHNDKPSPFLASLQGDCTEVEFSNGQVVPLT